MKILNQIITAGIVIALIFLIQSDYKSIPSKVLSYLKTEISKTSVIYNDKASDVKDFINNEIINSTKDNTDVQKADNIATPGALTVSPDYLTYNTKSINLTIKGVIDITNKYRQENGSLPALTENSKLDFSAEKKLQDMFAKQYFEHESPSGVGVGDLANQISYEYIVIGENLALGNFKDNKALVDAWMASPGHRANILNKRYTEIGISVGKGTYEGKNVWMAVQHFGLPKSACPSIDNILYGVIDLEQQKIKDTESDLASRKAKIDSGAIFEGMTTNGQIDQYNALVSDYNKLVTGIKEKINKYNEEVRNFNNCIAEVN